MDRKAWELLEVSSTWMSDRLWVVGMLPILIAQAGFIFQQITSHLNKQIWNSSQF
jgi:hypothetical protein